MEIIYKDEALLDLKYWKKSGNKQVQKEITDLIKDIILHSETGMGKPEPLKHELTGLWSRHITAEHRIVYKVEDNVLYIASLKGHYRKYN
ncbi:MAG: Txe/YoeB family addiction module toxin [Lentimicrobiaceae bacterium]|nr:Txe/YoeB family addiction module toxin [Lentimicrobiaceae bacterium]